MDQFASYGLAGAVGTATATLVARTNPSAMARTVRRLSPPRVVLVSIDPEGVMIKIKEGNAPRSACTGGQVEAHFSGGDITKISVGDGLVTVPSDGANGNVRIELAAGQALPQGCDDAEGTSSGARPRKA